MKTTEAERALRLERVEVRCAYEWVEAAARREPDQGYEAWAPVEGAVAVWMGRHSPLSRVIGLGLAGRVRDDALEPLEDVFRARRTPLRTELCPLAGGYFGRKLTNRGHRVHGFEDMLVREIAPGDADVAAHADERLGDGVRIVEVDASERATWARVAVEGFFEDEDEPPGFAVQMEASLDVPDSAFYLAYVDGVPAACSGVTWREGVAALFGMATLPDFRRRGIQGAMVAHRLARAARAECDLASVGAEPGGNSHRNLERAGFRTAYTRTIFMLSPFGGAKDKARAPA